MNVQILEYNANDTFREEETDMSVCIIPKNKIKSSPRSNNIHTTRSWESRNTYSKQTGYLVIYEEMHLKRR